MQAFFVKTQKFQKLSKYPFTNQENCAIIYKSSGYRQTKYSGVSPSGKAADSDSVISRVQILPPQPHLNATIDTKSLRFSLYLKRRICVVSALFGRGQFYPYRFFGEKLESKETNKSAKKRRGKGCILPFLWSFQRFFA